MNLNNARYEATAVRPNQYPVGTMPEVAFVGRSNVGKSSIINAMLNRRNLARKSGTPGKTKEINFYNIDHILYFVDLPGYGYASVSKEKKSTWGDIINTYLTTRSQMILIILLVDIRHAPSKEDQVMMDWLLQQEIPYLVVANKSDKLTRSQIPVQLGQIGKALGLPQEIKPIPFSAETKQGVDVVWKEINGHLTPQE